MGRNEWLSEAAARDFDEALRRHVARARRARVVPAKDVKARLMERAMQLLLEDEKRIEAEASEGPRRPAL